MNKVKLEYKEENGIFHFNRKLEEPDSNGYESICKSISYDNALEFTEKMHKKYTGRLYRGLDFKIPENPLSFSELINEFEEFLLN